jgi:hypothetical protein
MSPLIAGSPAFAAVTSKTATGTMLCHPLLVLANAFNTIQEKLCKSVA